MRGAIEVFPWNDERIAEIRGDGTVHWKTSQDLLDRRGKNIGRISGNLVAFFPKQRRGFVLMFDGNTLMEMDTSTGEVSFHRQKVLPFSVDKKTMQFWREGEILSLSDFLTLHHSGRIGTCSSETAGAKIQVQQEARADGQAGRCYGCRRCSRSQQRDRKSVV